MSAMHTNTPALSGSISRAAYVAVRSVALIRETLAARKTRAMLLALSDAQLEDIGLNRADVRARTTVF
ncbi:DUF1127 domain-containing protein [Litorivita sp. NS0012-18]|uniref:DUF1127 domain-containing protein n=1 Tax=Litorivita sp. NS0012-18 TaxID=3127655 RepID=UPI0031045658